VLKKETLLMIIFSSIAFLGLVFCIIGVGTMFPNIKVFQWILMGIGCLLSVGGVIADVLVVKGLLKKNTN